MNRSPLFYVGDKYKLVPQLLKFFPKKITKYVEPFYGGGSSSLQVTAKEYVFNDIDPYIIALHKMLIENSANVDGFFEHLFSLINQYGLSCSYLRDDVPIELKRQYPKTYYSHFNKESYRNLKADYNKDAEKDCYKLYLLLIYGFNHMIRFNSKGEFNLPVGNVDFNKNVYEALVNYFTTQGKRDISFCCSDFEAFTKSIPLEKGTFFYFDPPYLISMSEYNKFWSEKDEQRLYDLLDWLNQKKVRFGITNLLQHKGARNTIFEEWSHKYKVEYINSNYISFNDNTIKSESSQELYVHN